MPLERLFRPQAPFVHVEVGIMVLTRVVPRSKPRGTFVHDRSLGLHRKHALTSHVRVTLGACDE